MKSLFVTWRSKRARMFFLLIPLRSSLSYAFPRVSMSSFASFPSLLASSRLVYILTAAYILLSSWYMDMLLLDPLVRAEDPTEEPPATLPGPV